MTPSERAEQCKGALEHLISTMGYADLGDPENALKQATLAHGMTAELLGDLLEDAKQQREASPEQVASPPRRDRLPGDAEPS
jgi:hypothetical protein